MALAPAIDDAKKRTSDDCANNPDGHRWGSIARVTVSARSNRHAPARAAVGISRRWSGPVTKRTMWGTSSPTKPMIPETATQAAAINEALTSIVIDNLAGDTPSEAAVRLPMANKLRSRPKNKAMANPAPTTATTMPTSVQVLEAKLPINQKMMMPTSSPAIYLMKLTPADRMAATMMPERIRLAEDRSPLLAVSQITTINVPTAPANANNGSDQALITARFIHNAMAAPKAAPDETPRV